MAAVNGPNSDSGASEKITFSLDGRNIDARLDETILQAARRHGTEIPHLCYMDGLRPDGNCRACVVEINGERALAPSCCRTPTEGMQVSSHNERARTSQKMVLELLKSDVVETPYTRHSELELWATKLAVGTPRFPARHQPAPRRVPPGHCGESRRLYSVYPLSTRLP